MTSQTTTLFHAGLTVRDIERTLVFYRDVVGMSVDPVREYGGVEFDRLTNNSGTRIKWTYATLDQFRLQFIQYLSGGGTAIAPQHNRPGSVHLSFYVSDAKAKFRAIEQMSAVEITSELVHQPGPNMLSFYVNDPDGTPVEFLQRLPEQS